MLYGQIVLLDRLVARRIGIRGTDYRCSCALQHLVLPCLFLLVRSVSKENDTCIPGSDTRYALFEFCRLLAHIEYTQVAF